MRRFFLFFLALGLLWGRPFAARSTFATYQDVRPVLAALAELLPAELRSVDDGGRAPGWLAWITAHDRAIRARVRRGDDDTLVNWLLFGTSFTSRQRAVLGTPGVAGSQAFGDLARARAGDLVSALASPAGDERRVFARSVLARAGYGVDTAEARTRAQAYLVDELVRVIGEYGGYARDLEASRQLGDTSEEFAARSKLFRDRGLSADTSILPSFALERAVRQMLADGVIRPRSVRRVAVIGPGLDFADKSAGYDFYPPQTVQPFALLDTLARLGASPPAGADLVTLDLSPRVNDHVGRARQRARSGAPYLLQLPLDGSIDWTPDVLEYWKRIGDEIGAVSTGAAPAGLGASIQVRVVRVRPDVVARVSAEDLDVVAQRFDGAAFDMVVATNVFVYYDTLDQALALAAVSAMLKPGGVFLSNNALLELPATPVHSAGYLTVPYSSRSDDGDHIVWYRRSPG